MLPHVLQHAHARGYKEPQLLLFSDACYQATNKSTVTVRVEVPAERYVSFVNTLEDVG